MTPDEYEVVIAEQDGIIADLRQELADAEEDRDIFDQRLTVVEGELSAITNERDKYYNALEDIEAIARRAGL